MKKQFIRIALVVILFPGVAASLMLISSCRCDEKVYMAVMVGSQGEKGCREIADLAGSGKLPNISYACPGDTLTICWGGNVGTNKLEPGLGTVGSAGSKQIVVTQSMKIKIVPQNSCASSSEFTVNVINMETPSEWDARWEVSPNEPNKKCSYLAFEISPYFMSPNIMVTKAEAKFNPTDATNSPCAYPPYCTGKNIDYLAFPSVQLNKPFETVPFSKPPPAVGHWRFPFSDPHCSDECKSDASVPFVLTLNCQKN